MLNSLQSGQRRRLGGFGQFFKGILRADAYQKYLEHMARTHPDQTPVSEATFWRERYDWEDRNPQGRCC